MNWLKDKEFNKGKRKTKKLSLNQFKEQMITPSRMRRCGHHESLGDRTFQQKQRSRSISRSILITARGASIVLRASRDWRNMQYNPVTERD